VLITGEGASGKSIMIKDQLFSQMLQYSQNYYLEHITCSHSTTGLSVKTNIERSMQVKRSDLQSDKDEMGRTINSIVRDHLTDTGRLKPDGDSNCKLIVYLEDLHMTGTDKFNDLPGLEVVRDLLTTSEWYSTSYKSRRVIEDTNLIACMNHQAE